MIKFNKKTTGGTPLTNVDVSVTSGIQHGGTNEPSLRFSFSERITMMVFGSDPYGVAGQDQNNPNRIYFSAENPISGYKISGMNGSGRKYSTFGSCYPAKKYGDFVGYYSMKYDKVNGAFYIDRTEKKTY